MSLNPQLMARVQTLQYHTTAPRHHGWVQVLRWERKGEEREGEEREGGRSGREREEARREVEVGGMLCKLIKTYCHCALPRLGAPVHIFISCCKFMYRTVTASVFRALLSSVLLLM